MRQTLLRHNISVYSPSYSRGSFKVRTWLQMKIMQYIRFIIPYSMPSKVCQTIPRKIIRREISEFRIISFPFVRSADSHDVMSGCESYEVLYLSTIFPGRRYPYFASSTPSSLRKINHGGTGDRMVTSQARPMDHNDQSRV